MSMAAHSAVLRGSLEKNRACRVRKHGVEGENQLAHV